MRKHLFYILVLGCVINANAQFFRGIGIFVGGNTNMHRYKNTEADKKDFSYAQFLTNPEYYYPQSHWSREYQSWDVGLFLELLNNDGVRWQTEFEYTKKGAREMEISDRYFGTRTGSYGLNRYTMLQWNNYLKFFSQSNYYTMIGVKLEYALTSAASVFTPVSGSLKKIWFSGDVGVGKEFNTRRKLKPFVEFHYNPDVIYQRISNVRFRARTFELRVGVIYRPKRKAIDDCNAPTYHGNYY